jgi:hypothetical protein
MHHATNPITAKNLPTLTRSQMRGVWKEPYTVIVIKAVEQSPGCFKIDDGRLDEESQALASLAGRLRSWPPDWAKAKI